MSEVEMLGTTDYEKTLWEKFHAGTTESRHYKSQTQKEFRVLFPNGHKDSIRDLFAEIAEKAKFGKRLNKVFGSLSNVHPRAWDIILEYGKDYVPTSWVNSTPQESSWQPTAGFCFQNAYELMKVSQDGLDRPSRLTYVEGFAMGPTALPMLHAWNGSGFSKRAVDWTFYAHSTWVS